LLQLEEAVHILAGVGDLRAHHFNTVVEKMHSLCQSQLSVRKAEVSIFVCKDKRISLCQNMSNCSEIIFFSCSFVGESTG